MNQKYKSGDKYSGALGTYTAKHTPLAIYAKEVDKTFFVYGGTRAEDERHLLCMIGEYNHKTGMLSKPTVVYDKNGIDDPHDNPSIMIDNDGFIWVFVSGRAVSRPGFKYKSKEPYNIDVFIQMTEEEFTYPQPWNTVEGHFHFFTKYTGVRQLYFETNDKGHTWEKNKTLTENSELSHSYVRRPVHYKSPFCFFWSDGNSHNFSKSHLYFGDFKGNIWQMPYEMKSEFEKPIKIK